MHKAEKRTNQMTRATLSIIGNLVKNITAAEKLAKLKEEDKKSPAGTRNLLVWYTIIGRIFEIPCNYKPVVEKKHASLEEEVVQLQHKNEALQAAVDNI